ncbi:zinc-binding dehydrogenase [Candidatus Poribacteria bacterium]|nr:zinc-binding dehydrogenase [Candidatus Poribacteria bacterium]
MKAIVVEKPNVINYREFAKPELEPGEVLIKLRCTSICATDFAVIAGKVPMAKYPVIPGHEWTGVVEEVVDEKDEYLIGKRVVAENQITCMRCPACRQGKWTQCPTYDEVGYSWNGAYAEYLKTIANNVHPLPDNVSAVEAALIEPTAVALHVMLKATVQAGDNVTILGDGPIGILCMQIARLQGGQKIFVAGGHDERLELCQRLGAYEVFNRHKANASVVEAVQKIHPDGSDIVIEAAGSPNAFKAALEIAGQGAKIGISGFCEWEEATLQPDLILVKNLTIVGANSGPGMWNRAIRLVANKEIDLKSLVTHTFKLADYEQALDIVEHKRDGIIKGVFMF